MKTILLSSLRHALTALAGLGGYLAAKGAVAPEEAAGLDAAGANLAEALAVIAAALLARLAIYLLAKIKFPVAAGAFGLAPLFGMVGTAAAVGTLLPSCSDSQMATIRALPIQGYFLTDHGRVGYSAKGGLVVEVDAQSGK